ncbi:hypothetical protein QR674_14440 [Acinetobacter chinensis]|uniref:Uncharacterized protein n=1 Tax=Acinetobacter chinensis TaxID=2004650 RepID=A0ABU3WIE2_9GAMM|nr:hypothetical protein [Acinetobacter chinensis]MDV2470177.1 hypothetical protein [Acinetobacter chinensis]
MWSELPIEKKEKYKLLITNFASLSKVFSQKSSNTDDNNITPIVNSKFQETAFQKAFDAISEDIANTSYDASVKLDNKKKYLVGIKSFGYTTGYQKVAQFKSDSASDDWSTSLSNIKKNVKTLEPTQANKLNNDLYKKLALKVANLRNARIASSKAQIKGFNGSDIDVESIYHVLMPFKKKDQPQILVGQISYLPIDIDNIKITKNKINKKHPQNFEFTDGNHNYRYTSSDSQLLMDFKNKDIVLETWDINYHDNPFYFFENLHLFNISQGNKTASIQIKNKDITIDSVCWMIPNELGELEESSGYNSFDGSTKLGKEDRKVRISQIQTKYKNKISTQELDFTVNLLESILLKDWRGKSKIKERKELRANLIAFVQQIKNKELLEDIEKLVFRSSTEMYIPIPDSKQFHMQKPNFFGKDIGTFLSDGKTLALPTATERKFKLEFIPSGNVIEAYINQEAGKSIQSITNQDILGKWILWDVFQLKERELLTLKKLNDIGINGIRLTKFKDEKRGIGLEFIWIDEENPPEDSIGWVAKNKKDA